MNRRKVWTIVRHEYAVNVRRPGFIIMTALVPILAVLGMGVAVLFGSQAGRALEAAFVPEQGRVAVVDHSGHFQPILPRYSQQFVLYADEQAARQAVDSGEADMALFIPADYVESGRLLVYSQGSGLTAAAVSDSDRVRGFLVAHLLRDRVPENLLKRAAAPMAEIVPVTGQGEESEGGPLSFIFSFIIPYFLAVMLVVTIFVASGYLLQGIAEEKENRLVEIVLSSVTALEWFTGKIVGLGAVGLTQVLIWLITAVGLSGGSAALLALAIPTFPLSTIVLIVVYYLLGFALYAALMAGLGALGTSMRESQQLAGIVSLFAAVPFMVSGILFSNPDATLVRALSIFPFTAPGMMIMRLPLSTVQTVDIVASLILLGLCIPGTVWLGAKIFRIGILVYGKRPGVREIWSALRAA